MAARAGATHALAEKSITTIRRPEPVAHYRRRDQLWRHQPEGLGIGEDKSIVKFRPAGSREGLSDYLRDGCADDCYHDRNSQEPGAHISPPSLARRREGGSSV